MPSHQEWVYFLGVVGLVLGLGAAVFFFFLSLRWELLPLAMIPSWYSVEFLQDCYYMQVRCRYTSIFLRVADRAGRAIQHATFRNQGKLTFWLRAISSCDDRGCGDIAFTILHHNKHLLDRLKTFRCSQGAINIR